MKRLFCAGVLAVYLLPTICAANEDAAPKGPDVNAQGVTVQGLTREQHRALLRHATVELTTDQKPLLERYKAMSVRWVRFPNPYQLQSYYPKAAAKAGVRAVVLAECDWNAQGAITDCRTLEENPKEYGFAEATRAVLMNTGQLGTRPGTVFAAGTGVPVIIRWELQ
jgi:hypothetical protein